MEIGQLVDYIREENSKGHSFIAIREHLIEQGYDSGEVDAAVEIVRGVEVSKSSEVKSNKSFIWIGLGVLFLVFIVGLFFYLQPKAISESEFSQGANFQLEESGAMKFSIDDEQHSVEVESVGSDSVSLIIRSYPVKVDLKVGEEKRIDLDDDGFFDVLVKLKGINEGVPDLYIRKIHESACVPDWDCEEWSSCSVDGEQFRVCEDLNSCGGHEGAPETTQGCDYVEECVSDWECGDWESCVDGKQTRNCEDLNSCGTAGETSRNCVKEEVDEVGDVECPLLFEKIMDCEEYSCEASTGTVGVKSERKVLGFEGDNCMYSEYTSSSMGDLLTECVYPSSLLPEISEYYELIVAGGKVRTLIANDETGAIVAKKMIGDKEVKEPTKDYGACDIVDLTALNACGYLPDKLRDCEPYSCEFSQSFYSQGHQVFGLDDEGRCRYDVSVLGLVTKCNLTEGYRNVFADYYEDSLELLNTFDLSGDIGKTYDVDGENVVNIFEATSDNGMCVSG